MGSYCRIYKISTISSFCKKKTKKNRNTYVIGWVGSSESSTSSPWISWKHLSQNTYLSEKRPFCLELLQSQGKNNFGQMEWYTDGSHHHGTAQAEIGGKKWWNTKLADDSVTAAQNSIHCIFNQQILHNVGLKNNNTN